MLRPQVSVLDLHKHPGERSANVRDRVVAARNLQTARCDLPNARLDTEQVREFCQLDNQSKLLLERTEQKKQLSPRAVHRILKVARTVADLGNSENINVDHVAEAITYRRLS